mmetsp:Transcript_4985/g.6440  ORF Transcript_4985/g.6440 Transcript_4985/m.6440 type:complete len:106 (+) Transcript_4985:591-908(+)
MIINLSKDINNDLIGGSTRFYPYKNYSKAIDILIPRGWAIAFKQQGMLHAGHQVLNGIKHIAQAGLLRKLPEGIPFKPSTFRPGPDLQEAISLHAQTLSPPDAYN